MHASSALWLSVKAGFWAVLLGLPLATALGFRLARGRFAGRFVLSALTLAPMVLPPTVTGLLLLRAVGPRSAVGAFLEARGMGVAFGFPGVALAALVVSLPLLVSSARAAFEAVDPRLERLSLAAGVSPARTFLRVTLPLALPGLAAGAVLGFARALGEFGATVVLAGNREGETRTLALAVYTLLEGPEGEAGLAPLLYASLGCCLASLLGYEALLAWQRRRLGDAR